MKLFNVIFVFFYFLIVIHGFRDPYKVLGVAKSSSVLEIKRAYKRLAREWHPDKNKTPGAEEKFIEVNKAYELLMDPERRRQFDYHGITEDGNEFTEHNDHGQFRRYDFNPFQSFFNRGGFQFNFNQGTVYHKYTITSRAYENNVIPKSSTQPYLIIFYGDMCFPCINAEPVWQKIISEMEPLGMGFASIHVQQEAALARKIGVSTIPYVIGIADGRITHYKQDQLSLTRVIEFSRRLFPPRTIATVDESSLHDFLNGWSDNRIRILLFSKSDPIRLRYLLLAYKFQSRAAFGHITLDKPESKVIQQRYGVSSEMESLLVFNENYASPIATLSMKELASQTMMDVIEANKFLILPRLSSQELFDQLCPPDVTRARKRLCVILITKNTPAHDPHRAMMRD